MKFNLKSFLTSPWTILGAIIAGILGGVYAPAASMNFESVGGIYISLLKVVVIPFLLATILVGVISLLQKEGSASMIRKIIIGFVSSMFIAAVIGVGTVALTGSEMTPVKQAQLGSIVNDKESGSDLNVTLKDPMPKAAHVDPMQMAQKFIPENIFNTLAAGGVEKRSTGQYQYLQVLKLLSTVCTISNDQQSSW
ncbi:MAG: cation:dicarboxylase symporter family transporter [Alphaproteobacteria bacterium]|nr:cation:dicarboxylase symporter family transporter [Alphaproteobacteria bacterium]